jgi:hypothetical protein
MKSFELFLSLDSKLFYHNNQSISEGCGSPPVFFGQLKKHEQQQKVMDWIQRGGTKSHQPFLLPFVTPLGTAITCLKEIDGHMICISALVSLLGVGSFWYNTCQTFVNKGTIPRHDLCVKDSNCKRKFAEEEEEDLKAFMDNLQLFAEPSVARFVREVTGQIELRNRDDDALYLGRAWTKQDSYKCYCDG